MEDQTLPIQFNQCVEFSIPEFGTIEKQVLDMTKIREAEGRILEAKVVNGGTYNELEFTMNEGYREAKKNLSLVGYNKLMTEKAIRKAKSEALIDEYSDWLKETRLKDSAAIREAFLETKESYTKAVDRLNMLIAIESLVEGKIKVFENVCRYIRKEMDIRIRSGMIDSNLYGSK